MGFKMLPSDYEMSLPGHAVAKRIEEQRPVTLEQMEEIAKQTLQDLLDLKEITPYHDENGKPRHNVLNSDLFLASNKKNEIVLAIGFHEPFEGKRHVDFLTFEIV